MRKFIFVAAIALLGTLGLSACSHNQGGTEGSGQAKVTRPASTAVDDAMKACLAKHPKAAAALAAQKAASAASVSSAPASAASNAAPSLAQTDDSDNPCIRANLSASVWQGYLQQIVLDNMGNVTASPYIYFVPSGSYPENQGAIGRVQEQVNDTVAATVLPGNMVVAAGPNSTTTAQVLENAFKNASPGSFKGVVVLFIGDQADDAAVKAAIAPSGATFKFAKM